MTTSHLCLRLVQVLAGCLAIWYGTRDVFDVHKLHCNHFVRVFGRLFCVRSRFHFAARFSRSFFDTLNILRTALSNLSHVSFQECTIFDSNAGV
jgi:hypothetical protein